MVKTNAGAGRPAVLRLRQRQPRVEHFADSLRRFLQMVAAVVVELDRAGEQFVDPALQRFQLRAGHGLAIFRRADSPIANSAIRFR